MWINVCFFLAAKTGFSIWPVKTHLGTRSSQHRHRTPYFAASRGLWSLMRSRQWESSMRYRLQQQIFPSFWSFLEILLGKSVGKQSPRSFARYFLGDLVGKNRSINDFWEASGLKHVKSSDFFKEKPWKQVLIFWVRKGSFYFRCFLAVMISWPIL